jgi:CelD/BcsL family acetyltransferase involved in cellulose biosynthesis
LRGHILYLDGQPSALWIASLHRGVLANDFMAFDPAYGKYAPGMYLALKVIEEVRCDPAATSEPAVDFGIGDAEWKMRLANDQWQEWSIVVFAPTAKGLALNASRTFAALADRCARALLQRSRLLPQLKRLWRRRLVRTV